MQLFIPLIIAIMLLPACELRQENNKSDKDKIRINNNIEKDKQTNTTKKNASKDDTGNIESLTVNKSEENNETIRTTSIDQIKKEDLSNKEKLETKNEIDKDSNVNKKTINDVTPVTYAKVKAEIINLASAFARIDVSNESAFDTAEINLSIEDNKPAFSISLLDNFGQACNTEKCTNICSNPLILKANQSCSIYIHSNHKYSSPTNFSIINPGADQRLDFLLSYNEKLYLTGNFTDGTNHFVAHYDIDSKTWGRIAQDDAFPLNDTPYVLEFDPDGNLYVAGRVKNDDQYQIFTYNFITNTWSELPQPISLTETVDGVETKKTRLNSLIYAMTFDNNNNMYVAGHYNDGEKTYVLKYNTLSKVWSDPLPQPSEDTLFQATLYDLAFDGNDTIYAGGKLKTTDDNLYIAKYNITNNAWTTHPNTDANKSGDYYTQFCLDRNNHIYIAGSMSITRESDNVSRQYILRYQADDDTWLNLNNPEYDESTFFNMRTMVCHVADNGMVYFGGHVSTYLDHIRYPNKLLLYFNPSNTTLNVIDDESNLINDAVFGINSDVHGNIYLIGNFKNNNEHRYVLKYAPDSETWESLAIETDENFDPTLDFSKGLFNTYGGYRRTMTFLNHLDISLKD